MPCYYKVVPLAHAADGLDDLGFIIRDNFDAFQVLGTSVSREYEEVGQEKDLQSLVQNTIWQNSLSWSAPSCQLLTYSP
jgi:hypothetical protein